MIALGARAPFVATAFHTALDMAAGHALLAPRSAIRVPILGLLQGDDEAELRDAFERLLADGYRTVKVKVGFDVEDDLRALATIQTRRRRTRGDPRRCEPGLHGGGSRRRSSRSADPAGIELFEQPCAAGDWDAHRAGGGRRGVARDCR